MRQLAGHVGIGFARQPGYAGADSEVAPDADASSRVQQGVVAGGIARVKGALFRTEQCVAETDVDFTPVGDDDDLKARQWDIWMEAARVTGSGTRWSSVTFEDAADVPHAGVRVRMATPDDDFESDTLAVARRWFYTDDLGRFRR